MKWISLSDALEKQRTEPKKIFIDFYANWCGPCKTMDKETYNNPVISELINTNFYPVKFDAETNEVLKIYNKEFTNPDFKQGAKKNSLHEFTKFMNVNSIPSIVFLDEVSNPITILNGLLFPKEIEPYISMIATDEFKKIKTRKDWDDYQKKFKSKLK